MTSFVESFQADALVILDGLSAHASSLKIMDYANKNDIILLSLPSHTLQPLQSLDRAFFNLLKSTLRKQQITG